MITRVKLINVSFSDIVTSLCVSVRVPEIYSLSKFPVFNTVILTIVIMLYIRSLDLFILQNCRFIPFDLHLPISFMSPPLVSTVSLYAPMKSTFKNSTYEPPLSSHAVGCAASRCPLFW